jgi:hypothetical protein
MFSKNIIIPYEESNEKQGMFEFIPLILPNERLSYNEFLKNNLSENIVRPINTLIELYPGMIKALWNEDNKIQCCLNSKSKEKEKGLKPYGNIKLVKFTQSRNTLISMGGLNVLLPIYSSLVNQLSPDHDYSKGIIKFWNPTQAELKLIEVLFQYLFEIVKTYKLSLDHSCRTYLENVEKIDIVLEKVYRAINEYVPLPTNFWTIESWNYHFFKINPLLFYIDCLKNSIFSQNSPDNVTKKLLLFSEFYTESNWNKFNEKTAQAQERIVNIIVNSQNSHQMIGLVLDIYYRFKEYLFLREVLRKIIKFWWTKENKTEKGKRMIDFLFKLMIHYIEDVDMNLSVSKTTSPTERYIRVVDLLNVKSIDADPVVIYFIIDKIYNKVKILQYEKPYKKVRRNSFSKNSKNEKLMKFQKNDEENDEASNFFDMDFGPKSLSIVIEDKNIALELWEFQEDKKYDVLLSVLLSKTIAIYLELKYRLASINKSDAEQEVLIKENIFASIDIRDLVIDILDFWKDEIYIEITHEIFYKFIPFIKSNPLNRHHSGNENEATLSFIELIFPVLTSNSQIDIIESGLAEFVSWIETERLGRFLHVIDSPYFAFGFLKIKLKEITEKVVQISENSLLELLYWFEDFLLEDYHKIIFGNDHQWVNLKRSK